MPGLKNPYWHRILAVFIFFISGSCQAQKSALEPDMVLIPGGTFMMGQNDGEGDERPVHQVTLKEFYISKYELTVAEFRSFCDATGRAMPKEPEFGWQDDHPILNTSWYDAVAYIEWLNEQTGENYRLPTEAEFEYVLRNGGETGVYPWPEYGPINENIADNSLKDSGWGRSTWPGYNDGFVNSSSVGSFPANKLGVYDINGNAWEWCSDWYTDYSPESLENPQGPETGTHKVGRGASFNSDPWHCRSAGRSWVKPDFKGPGFRLAK